MACGLLISCFFQAEGGIRELVRSRGLEDVYKRQSQHRVYVDSFNQSFNYEVDHVALADWADVVVIALSLIHI